MSSIDLPTQADVRRIYETLPFERLNEHIFDQIGGGQALGTGLAGLKRDMDARESLWQLHYRLMDVAKSYVMLRYFFEKGIPDDEWCISPGRTGASVEYFPHFEAVDYLVKDWFDYYSEVFYYMLFSALDMAGHLLNARYDLGIKQRGVDFDTAMKKLKTRDQALHDKLADICDNADLREARRLRNDVAHNYLPSSTGMVVTLTEDENGGGIGLREYVTSSQIRENVQKVVALLERIVLVLTT